MLKTTRTLLREALAARYRYLRDRLAVRLGSRDLAGEALHETWIRLGDGPDLAPVANSDAYLYRAALNTASNISASERRHVLNMVEIHDIIDMPDPAPDQERAAIARSEIATLRRLLKQLPKRQRDIFIANFTGEATTAELAARHGVTIRTIQIELRDAVLHCALEMDRKNLFANGAFRLSRK